LIKTGDSAKKVSDIELLVEESDLQEDQEFDSEIEKNTVVSLRLPAPKFKEVKFSRREDILTDSFAENI